MGADKTAAPKTKPAKPVQNKAKVLQVSQTREREWTVGWTHLRRAGETGMGVPSLAVGESTGAKGKPGRAGVHWPPWTGRGHRPVRILFQDWAHLEAWNKNWAARPMWHQPDATYESCLGTYWKKPSGRKIRQWDNTTANWIICIKYLSLTFSCDKIYVQERFLVF